MRTYFCKEKRDIILQAIRNGDTKINAARLAGVSKPTMENWRRKSREMTEREGLEHMTLKELQKLAKFNNVRGAYRMNKKQLIEAIEEADELLRRFDADMEQAEAEAISEHVQNIKRHSKEQWQASAWYLERIAPEEWGRKDRVHVQNEHSGTIKTEHTEHYKLEIEQKLSQDPELQELYRQIWERQQLHATTKDA